MFFYENLMMGVQLIHESWNTAVSYRLGSQMRTAMPALERRSILMEPACASTISRHKARPRPEPDFFVE